MHYYPSISKREKEVLQCVALGMSAKQISCELIISTETVKTHKKNLLLKLDAKNSAEMIFKAFCLGILERPGLQLVS